MKSNPYTGWLSLLALLSVSTLGPGFSTCYGQGASFTFQGRLNDGVAAANGTYDLRFSIYGEPVGGGPIGGPVTNAAVAVNNGLFTVMLDFDPTVFDGTGRWLEIGVRTNASPSDFQTLGSRQPLTSTPYAIRAANFSGPVSDSQLSSNIARLDSDQTFSGNVSFSSLSNNYTGTFIGNGGGMTNVPGAIPTQVEAGPTVQAQPNVSYLANFAGQVRVTLPANANIGDLVRVSGIGPGGWLVVPGPFQAIEGYQAGVTWTPRLSGSWSSVASSADSSRLIAAYYGGQIFISSDGGSNWTSQATNRNWYAVASSADGSRLVAGVSGGQIYVSTDGGTNWTARANNGAWRGVASSADGMRLAAIDGSPGQIWVSVNGGVTWTARENNRSWYGVASSADGHTLIASVYGGQLYVSTDGGTNWLARDSARSWIPVASSADGTRLLAGVYGGAIYGSTDGGLTWAPHGGGGFWFSMASSADGSKLAAGQYGSQIHTSSDGGTNWTARGGLQYWYGVASSADGSKLVACANFGPIYTSASQALQGGQGSTVELRYAGNGLWLPTSPPRSSAAEPNTLVARDADGTINATAFVGDGSGLTNLDASQIKSGTLADARLSSNVALRNGSPTFSGQVTTTGGLRLSDANLWLRPGSDLNHGLGWFGTGKLFNGLNVDGPVLFGASGGALGTVVGASSTNVLVWRSNGRVGIGTASPAFLLEVNGSAGKPGGGNWSTASDVRLKRNVHTLAGALEKLLALHGVTFEYIDPEKIHELRGERMGLIAQEVQKVFPDWVETGPDGYQRVTVRGLEALVVEALRQLHEEQTSKSAALKEQNEALAKRLADQEKEIAEIKARLGREK